MLVLFLLHYASACFMTGVIWIVQVVHYPLFRKVGREAFNDYEASHTKLIGFIVIPAMLTELATGIYLLFSDFFSRTDFFLYLIASTLLLIIWLSTIFIQARQHSLLSSGYNIGNINSLVKYNWIRTAGWTVRTVLLTIIFVSYIKNGL